MLDLVKKLEHGVTLVLIAMLSMVVALATLELGVTIVKDVVAPPILFPGIEKLLELFGKVLLVLIGIELLETMRAFASERVVRAEIVLAVALIALARKIIILEPEHVSTFSMVGLAALVAAIAFAYLVVVRGGRPRAL
jgi:uncharacterized membrane protein (DUF373 family)